MSIFTGGLGPGGLLMLMFFAIVGAYLAGFVIVWVHYQAVHDSALASIGIRGLNAVAPPPLPPDVEESIRSSMRANVVVFAGKTPFNGSGEQIDRWSFTVDTRVAPSTPGWASAPSHVCSRRPTCTGTCWSRSRRRWRTSPVRGSGCT